MIKKKIFPKLGNISNGKNTDVYLLGTALAPLIKKCGSIQIILLPYSRSMSQFEEEEEDKYYNMLLRIVSQYIFSESNEKKNGQKVHC